MSVIDNDRTIVAHSGQVKSFSSKKPSEAKFQLDREAWRSSLSRREKQVSMSGETWRSERGNVSFSLLLPPRCFTSHSSLLPSRLTRTPSYAS